MDYWFYGLSAITEFSMFWNLANVASMKYESRMSFEYMRIDGVGRRGI